MVWGTPCPPLWGSLPLNLSLREGGWTDEEAHVGDPKWALLLTDYDIAFCDTIGVERQVMIPSFITKRHILEAMQRIIHEGVPTQNKSKYYCVVKDGLHFPPKHTIALAHQVSTGRCLSSNEFSGGREANNFLKNRGFHIVRCSGSCTDISDPKTFLPTGHSERCPECKMRVRELLESIYGTCLVNHKFSWRTHPSSYAGTPIHSDLQRVAAILEEYRGFGFEDIVRTKTLPSCDYWVPDPGFIVEFDESQHFTNPRKLALSAYPGDQPLGFSREHWVKLCEQHNAKDNAPPYRDEQRAWYDTLRDFAPPLHGCRPTVRLHAPRFPLVFARRQQQQ